MHICSMYHIDSKSQVLTEIIQELFTYVCDTQATLFV